jgi:hypothetical protein
MAPARIEDDEFEGWLQLDDDDNNWVAQQASLGAPINLPWKKQQIRLGTCFQSRCIHGDPWLKENPFILSDLFMISKILRSENGSVSSFHSINTSRKSETSDHLSLGFGVGASLPFLCSASVKGTFDEDVQNNKDVSYPISKTGKSLQSNEYQSDKSSIRASVRSATIQLERNPRLCHEAIATLKYGCGYEAFTEKYGDYFLWGYRIGGDTGVMISSASFSEKKVESWGIEAKAEVLLVEVSHTWTKDFHSFAAGKSMKILGYDTLSNRNWNVKTAEDGSINTLLEQTGEIVLNSQNILERVLSFLQEHGMADGDSLSNEQCDFLTSNGAVVELLLLPMTAMRDVARWTTENDVI